MSNQITNLNQDQVYLMLWALHCFDTDMTVSKDKLIYELETIVKNNSEWKLSLPSHVYSEVR